MPQQPIQPDPDVTEFSRMVALKAVIETFDELLNSCTFHRSLGEDQGQFECLICGAMWRVGDSEGCGPHCVRVRAERAMDFLTKGGG